MNEAQHYRDTSLSHEERAEDLLQRMTLEQKIAQLQCIMTVGKNWMRPSSPTV